jgi:TPR repeat protein
MSASNGSDGAKVELPFDVNELVGVAVPIIISTTSHPSTSLAATALYLRAKLLSTGGCPDLLPKDQRQAFRDFEAAAKSGEARAWFRLGRDYEGFGDSGRARECFDKGKNKGDCECTYVS